MLVLSRKLNESILIGDHIEITVSSIRGNRVRLAISAPEQIPVMRAEIASQSCLFHLMPSVQPTERVPASPRV